MSLITPDFGLLFWMTLIFAVVFFILAKFGFPVITKMVDQRSERINESIRKAREAELRLANLAEEQKSMLEQARAEQARVLKETAHARDVILQDARQKAQEEASKIISDARLKIAAERESALRDIRKEVAVLSVGVAEKVLRKELSFDEAQKELIQRMVDEASSH